MSAAAKAKDKPWSLPAKDAETVARLLDLASATAQVISANLEADPDTSQAGMAVESLTHLIGMASNILWRGEPE